MPEGKKPRRRVCYICREDLEEDETTTCNDCRGVLNNIVEAHRSEPPPDPDHQAALRERRLTKRVSPP